MSNTPELGPTHAARQDPSSPSLLDLPAELRNRVYHYLFPEGRSAVEPLRHGHKNGLTSFSDRLGLLATNYQLYRETTSFLRVPGTHRYRIKPAVNMVDLVTRRKNRLIGERIMNLVYPENENETTIGTFDLVKGTSHVVIPPVLHNNRLLRYWALQRLKFRYTVISANFTSIDSWDTRMRQSVPASLSSVATSIFLQHPVGFNAAEFLWATDGILRAELCVEAKDNTGVMIRKSCFTLRQELLDFLESLVEKHPDRLTGHVLTVSIDENLNVVRADFQSQHGIIRTEHNDMTKLNDPDQRDQWDEKWGWMYDQDQNESTFEKLWSDKDELEEMDLLTHTVIAKHSIQPFVPYE